MKASLDSRTHAALKTRQHANTGVPLPVDHQRQQNQGNADTRDESLRTLGRQLAQRWEAAADSKPPRGLNGRWAIVRKLARRSCQHLQNLSQGKRTITESQRWILENARFLHGISNDVHDALKTFRTLPHVPLSQDQDKSVPRAYRIATAFLAAAGFAFSEEDFAEYLSGVQQAVPLEMCELWALKPLLQFVLLEQLYSSTDASTEASEHTAATPLPSCAPPSVVIESLHQISEAQWKDLFEAECIVDRILRGDPSGAYSRMDYESRQLYRDAVSDLARHSRLKEVEVAQWAVSFARVAHRKHPGRNRRVHQRRSNVGYYLLDSGSSALKRAIGYHPSFRKRVRDAILEWPEVYYVVGVELTTLLMVFLLLRHLGILIPLIPGILLLIPASQAAVGLMNNLTTWLIPPRRLARLDFSSGIPEEFRTLVVVPSLLLNEIEVRHIVESLEVRYLGNRDPNLHFALLTDAPDNSSHSTEQDALVRLCSSLIDKLNWRYAHHQQDRFFHLHRHHIFNPQENAWMGWERKRGKLLDLNKLLLDQADNFPVKAGEVSVLHDVRYVITLDSDTRLPRDSAHKLVGTLAHPLNRAVIDPTTNTVVEGHAILQPRVGVSTESVHKSRLARIYSGETGIDIYTCAVSDVYQDLFGEGSFTGKGIYEVKTFQRVLDNRFPTNALLSHDLIEGTYARAGLASDIEVIDDYPSHFSAYCRRMHRWVRGDWQILRWLFPTVPNFFGKMVRNPLTLLSRWKIFDNLRRSLIELNLFLLLLGGWFLFPGSPVYWTLVTLALLLIPTYMQTFLSLPWVISAKQPKAFLRDHANNFLTGHLQVFVMLVFLPLRAFVMADAIVRTLTRLTITHQKLLEWETAAESESGSRKKSAVETYLALTPWFALATALMLVAVRPSALFAASPLLVLWLLARAFTRWINQPPRKPKNLLDSRDVPFLRHASLATWRYFSQFSNAGENWLIPDRVQEAPAALIHSISPTNLGILLNARLAAHHLGYLTLVEFIDHTEGTLRSTKSLPRYKGHLLNWYDTKTLEPLPPKFISTVDSGNFAACLLTLKQGCLGMYNEPLLGPKSWQAICDHVSLVGKLANGKVLPVEVVAGIQDLSRLVDGPGKEPLDWVCALPPLEHQAREVLEALQPVDMDPLNDQPNTAGELSWWLGETLARIKSLNSLVHTLTPWLLPEYKQLAPAASAKDLSLTSLPAVIAGLERDLNKLSPDGKGAVSGRIVESLLSQIQISLHKTTELSERLQKLAAQADALFKEMDFRFLYDTRKKLLRVGYDVDNQHLAKSCYDLLASEARTATFLAVAKGDIEQESWFHLGRAQTRAQGQAPLVSWSGTLFEYLMPLLWMRSYPGTLLDQGMSSAVACQRKYAKKEHLPWGISEAAFNARDNKGVYQYYAFGLPELALNPGASKDFVVAPYASFLALMTDTSPAVKNLKTMQQKGWFGRFGFYEAVDYSNLRMFESKEYELIQCWMAHHQGMSLLAACNLLTEYSLQRWFHTDPIVMSAQLLLHEKPSHFSPDATFPASPIQPALQKREHETPSHEVRNQEPDSVRTAVRPASSGNEISASTRMAPPPPGENGATPQA